MQDNPDWLNVSRETIERLAFFAAEVRRWTPSINLISKGSVGDLWERHILDSAQLYQIAPANSGLWLDMGSGGGFPGLVMSIMGAPNMVLVESDQRKATFLREMARQMQLPVQVLSKRLEDIPPAGAKIMSARALSALTQLLHHANTHLAPGGVAIFPKGRAAQEEVAVAQSDWSFDLQIIPSKTDPDGRILLMSNIKPR